LQSDEQEIRQLVSTWMAASKARNAELVLSLMADDVVVLMPEQEVMGKAGFAAAARAQSGQGDKGTPRLNGRSEIQEIKVLGDWAFMWRKPNVIVTSPSDVQSDSCRLYAIHSPETEGKVAAERDANMLALV
jgi:uncharacterized protein (TIGR02246 family)